MTVGATVYYQPKMLRQTRRSIRQARRLAHALARRGAADDVKAVIALFAYADYSEGLLVEMRANRKVTNEERWRAEDLYVESMRLALGGDEFVAWERKLYPGRAHARLVGLRGRALWGRRP